ncbi:MAG: hypothetical protein ABSD70_19800 [Terracidiphilus sp.]|jgi:hypothetical protein
MSEPEPIEVREKIQEMPRTTETRMRAVGSPLSMGGGHRQLETSIGGDANRPAIAPGRALPGAVPGDDSSGIQRAVNVARSIIPIVQRLLPLLDGNIATVVANLMTPRSHPQPAPPSPKVDLAPLQESLAEIQTQHRNLHEQVMEQNSALKRVEDRLEMVREATDRNTLEQQELLEDLKAFSSRVKIIAVVGIILLGFGLVLELLVFLHLQRVLP